MMSRSPLHRALLASLGLLVIAPAMAVLVTGRNLADFPSLDTLAVAGLGGWLLRVSTLVVVAVSLAVIADRLLLSRAPPSHPLEQALLAAFLMFFVSNVVLPGLMGVTPDLKKNYFYAFAVFLALYVSRDEMPEHLLDAVKWAILIVLLASFAYAVVSPRAALRFYQPELRLPLVPFRFWGLGSGPNSIAPLALTLLQIAIVRPFASRAGQWTALGAAIAVILLAQSQTTWIISAVTIPPLLLYRRALARNGTVSLRVPRGLLLIAGGSAAAAAIIVVAMLSAVDPGDVVVMTPGASQDDKLLTGRGHLWRIAIYMFLDHPLFGYGLNAWGEEFRNVTGMAYAFHAHNQLLQSLSVAGALGGLGLVTYVAVLARASLRTAAVTGGLAPALATTILIGSISEAPLDLGTLLVGDTLRHVLLFGLVCCAYRRSLQAHDGLASARLAPPRLGRAPDLIA